VRTLLLDASAKLRNAGIDSANREARLLLAHAMGVTGEDIIAGRVAPDEGAAAVFDALVKRRAAREPLAYITGSKEFWSLDFKVGKGVLVPRPETETLVGEALKAFPDPFSALRVLDLGAGSGCLLLSVLSERKKATGLGIDRSEEALVFARANAEALGLAARAEFRVGDWRPCGAGFDIILTNPPYITTSEMAGLEPELSFEPSGALDAGQDGLNCYRALGAVIRSALGPDGLAFVELGRGQGESVRAIFQEAGVDVVRVASDLAGIPRCIVAKIAT